MKELVLLAETSMLLTMPLSRKNSFLNTIQVLVIAILSLASTFRAFGAIGDTAVELTELYGKPESVNDVTRSAQWFLRSQGDGAVVAMLTVYFDDEFRSQFENFDVESSEAEALLSVFTKSQMKFFKGAKSREVSAEAGEKWHWGEFSRTPKIGEKMLFVVKDDGTEDESLLLASGMYKDKQGFGVIIATSLKGMRMFEGSLVRDPDNWNTKNADTERLIRKMIHSDQALSIQGVIFSEITRLSDYLAVGGANLHVKINCEWNGKSNHPGFFDGDYLESIFGVKISSFAHFKELVHERYDYSKQTPLVVWSKTGRLRIVGNHLNGVPLKKQHKEQNGYLWVDRDRIKQDEKEARLLAEEKRLAEERIRLRLVKESDKKREWRDQLAPWGKSIFSHQQKEARSNYQAYFVLYSLKSLLDSDGVWLKEDRDEISFNRAKYGSSLVFVDQHREVTGSGGDPIHLKKGELVFVSEESGMVYPIDDALPLVKAILEDLPIQEFEPAGITFFGGIKWDIQLLPNRSEFPLYKPVRSRYRERNPQRWGREVTAIKNRIRGVGERSPRAAIRLYKQVLNEQPHLVTDAQSRLLFHLEFATETLTIQTKPSVSTDLRRIAETVGRSSGGGLRNIVGTRSSWKIQILEGEMVFRSHHNSIIGIDHPRVILDYLLDDEVPNWLVFPDEISDFGIALVSTIAPAENTHSFSHIPPDKNYEDVVLKVKREHEKIEENVYQEPVLTGRDFKPMGNIVDFGILCWGGVTVLGNLEIGALKLLGYGKPKDAQGNLYEAEEGLDITVLNAVRIRENVRVAHGELEGEVFQVKLSNKKTYWIARHERNSHTWAKKGWYVHAPPSEQTDMRLNLRKNHESKRACLEYLVEVIEG